MALYMLADSTHVHVIRSVQALVDFAINKTTDLDIQTERQALYSLSAHCLAIKGAGNCRKAVLDVNVPPFVRLAIAVALIKLRNK